MNTMVSGSEAYDLSLFEERPAQSLRVVKPSKKAVKAQAKRRRVQAIVNITAVIGVLVAVCAVVGMMIFDRVKITEINDQIIQQQEQLGILQSETIRLSNELAAQTSAEQVDAYAVQNGMHKIDTYQLQYITVDGGDKLEVARESDGDFFDTVAAAVSDFFDWATYLFQ